MKIEQNSGILSFHQRKVLELISTEKSESDCIEAFPFLPNTIKECIAFLAKNNLISSSSPIKPTRNGLALLAAHTNSRPADENSECKARKNAQRQKILIIAHNLSRRFHKKINKSLPIKGSPAWNEKWDIEIARLHTCDGYSVEEIAQTLDFICQDKAPSGFCFARNIRSLANIRTKWKNDMTKFATAYNAMLEKQQEQTGMNEKEPFDGKWAAEAEDLQEDLLFLPHPSYGSSAKKAIWNKCCSSIAKLVWSFVEARKWPATLFGDFRGHVLKIKKKGVVFSPAMLVDVVRGFFATYKGIVGYIDDEDGGRFDDTYMNQINALMEDAEKWR